MNGLPFTYYSLRKFFFFSKIIIVLATFTFVGGNVYNVFFRPKVNIDKSAYYFKEGFVLFSDGKKYINMLKNYHPNLGVKVHFHTMKPNESFWDVAVANGITVETLLAANPFLKSLLSEDGIEIVIPSENGVLLGCTNFTQALKMEDKLNIKPMGDYVHNIFEVFAMDDIRFAFFKNAKPAIVNNYIEGLYFIKHSFSQPVKGSFASFFGMRRDPFTHLPSFHSGLDILGGFGTKIKPIQDGIVSYSAWRNGYGNCVAVMHKDGYISLYAHCDALLVQVGDFVTKSTPIAILGNTGRSTGPHLHLEIERHGKLYNPLYFVW